MIEDQLKQAIARAVDLPIEDIDLSTPQYEEHGDYSTNVAMQFASMDSSGKSSLLRGVASGDQPVASDSGSANPRQIAEVIVQKLNNDNKLQSIVSKIEVAGPGFINFFLSDDVLQQGLENIIEKGRGFGKTDSNKGQRIMAEYGDANTHKQPHVGHLFSYVFGESLARILEFSGATVFRASYQGDVGLHVAKCLWAYQNENPPVPETLYEKAELMQRMYQAGSTAFKNDPVAQEEIKELNKKIYEADESVKSLWEKLRDWSLEYYAQFEARLGIKYDRHYYELEVFDEGMKLVNQNLGEVFEESEGAIIFPGSKYGLHDRVFITSYKTPTYEAKDLALQVLKKKEWPMDICLITTAHEQNEYFNVVFKALELLDPYFEGKLKHIGFGIILFGGRKIGSREGALAGDELLNMTVEAVAKVISEREDLDEDVRGQIAETVGVGALKYALLKSNPLQDVNFDIDQSISLEGNSGPYIQYTYARTQSVIEKAKVGKISELEQISAEMNHEERNVASHLIRFPGTIDDAAKSYSPNKIANYLYELSQRYNSFYNKHQIVGGDNEKLRLTLTKATGQVLQNGLYLLGITAPKKM